MAGKAEPERKKEKAREEKEAVNPAARRDRPGDAPPEIDGAENSGPEVPPVQEQPLDPLGPGGIGG